MVVNVPSYTKSNFQYRLEALIVQSTKIDLSNGSCPYLPLATKVKNKKDIQLCTRSKLKNSFQNVNASRLKSYQCGWVERPCK